ncbi:serine/threonine-protein kinase [Nocardioides sp.]|uniref:serine/threonine-protein kinase n=1 Tax=Nocardioides sp. TaxID=35761 RepID=UPI00286D1E79|nr:serine/threonine-protein kinase [Nocardioides sp.]
MALPERLGRLQQVRRLGVGGFATVWLYHDEELRSDVAVKALAENWAQRLDVRERFLEEARILRRADSDHIVRVYDVGEADGTPYFVMTYADLGSLGDVLERDDLPPPAAAVDMVRQAGAGLSVLHEHGVVHRDIKPQNLLVRSGGSAGDRILVADLGVAKAMLHASGLTQVVGTPSYMAPEQATGIGVDVRADVHALAAVTYQLLTGRLVRTGTLGELVHATLPPAPSSLADLPSAVDDVLLRALEPDPEDRWPDVASYVAALRAAVPAAAGAEQLTLWQLPDRPRAEVPSDGGPTWTTALISLLAFIAAFGVAYVVTTLV